VTADSAVEVIAMGNFTGNSGMKRGKQNGFVRVLHVCSNLFIVRQVSGVGIVICLYRKCGWLAVVERQF
jgi:hypothetical protein